MTEIILEKVDIEFPIYVQNNRSFKNMLIKAATGGIISNRENGSVVIQSLNNINLNVKDGDRLGIIGHNGSGKTTLLRVLSKVYSPIRGNIIIKGKVASMLNISLGMDGESTGLENIYLRGILMGLSKAKIRDITEDVCDFAELGEFINLPLRMYSSGMAMRLAFAISTRIEADILLMDEWLSVGDESFASKAEYRMKSLVGNVGILVIASHNHQMIKKLCNRCILLENGSIAEEHNY